MKETQPVRTAQSRGAELTPKLNPSTLDVRGPRLNRGGNIFMPEPGNGEKPPINRKSKSVSHPRTEIPRNLIEEQFNPERINAARIAWEELNAGRVISVDERRTQNDLIARGFMPEEVLRTLRRENSGREDMTAYEENQAEEARRSWERYNQQGSGVPIDRELQEMLIAWGQEPPPGGIPPRQPPGPPFGGGGEIDGLPEDDSNKWLNDLKTATAEGNFDEVDNLIDKNLDLGDPYAGPKIKALAEISLSNDAMTNGMYGYHLEYAMERVISQSDITPTDDYVQFTYYQQENLAKIILTARDFDKSATKDFYKYLSRLKNKRYIAHELFRSIKNREQYKEVISRYLRTEGFNFLENEIVGVSTTQMLWEKVLAHRVAGKKGWLDGEDFRNIHEEISGLLKMRHDKKPLQKTLAVNEQEVKRDIRPWEIDRAIIIGRVVAAATQRRTSYGVLGELPKEFDALFKSLDSEYIARVIAGRKIIGQRFLAEGSGASNKYMELWKKYTRKLGTLKGMNYGYKKTGGGEDGLYGHDIDSWILLDSGVPDIKSHSWRSTLMFLKERDYAVVDAGSPDSPITIGDYFDDVLKSIKEKDLDTVLNGLSKEQREEELAYINNPHLQLVNKNARIKNVIFSSKVSDIVLNQRLYLGTLVRHNNLTPRLKAELWKNVSEYLPSRIAAFFPNERREIGRDELSRSMYGGKTYAKLNEQERENVDKSADEKWEKTVQKLWIAEEMRVEAQADKVKNGDFTEEMLGNHYGQDMTDQEKEIIKQIVDLGKEKSGDLAKMVWPFNPFLDDVPKTGWMEGEEADLERLLVSDHDAYNTAINQELAGIIANPSMRPAESAEHLKKAVNGYAQVLGPDDAQGRIEADVLTRTELYSMKNVAKWYGYGIMRLFRNPTSLIEEYNIDAAISQDEDATSKDLELLAQNGVINNDTNKRDALGFTMLERIKERSKAARKDIWIMYIRLLMVLLPAEMAKEFMKILIPVDLAKSLG